MGFHVAPASENAASRRVLEKNGFGLIEVRPVATEPAEGPMAIYRLLPDASDPSVRHDVRAVLPGAAWRPLHVQEAPVAVG